jgi:hypothetical protein
MDLQALLVERLRSAHQFRSMYRRLAMLRRQLGGAVADEDRKRLSLAILEGSREARELGERLLELDASILKMETDAPAQRRSPMHLAPLEF